MTWALPVLGLVAAAIVGALFWLATWLDRTATVVREEAAREVEREAIARRTAIAMARYDEQARARRTAPVNHDSERRPIRIEWVILGEGGTVLGTVLAPYLPKALDLARERYGPAVRRVQSKASWTISQEESRTIRRDRVIRE